MKLFSIYNKKYFLKKTKKIWKKYVWFRIFALLPKIIKMKELKKEIKEILFELEFKGFYPIVIYHCVCDKKGKNIRFYLNDKNKVSQEVFYDGIEEKHHRKELANEEIKWVNNNMFFYEKIKKIC